MCFLTPDNEKKEKRNYYQESTVIAPCVCDLHTSCYKTLQFTSGANVLVASKLKSKCRKVSVVPKVKKMGSTYKKKVFPEKNHKFLGQIKPVCWKSSTSLFEFLQTRRIERKLYPLRRSLYYKRDGTTHTAGRKQETATIPSGL